MVNFIFIGALIILLCILCNNFSSKHGIPSLLLFIGLGLFFGSDGAIKIQFSNYSIAEFVCSFALIFIMFYGGFGTRWQTAKPASTKAVLLSTVGVIATAVFTGLFCYFILDFQLLESFLIGAVLSSTDAASVFSILRSRKLDLKEHTAPLLEVESGSNDPCSYMLTIIVLTIMNGNAKPLDFIQMIFCQFFFAIVCGVGLSLLALWILERFHKELDGYETFFMVAIALMSYALPALLGGNGYLSTYLVGIIMGNSSIRNKKTFVHFFDGVTGLMQMFIFFLLGLLAFPSQMLSIVGTAICILIFLTFVARPLAVSLLLRPFKCSWNQILLISWAGLRGASSIVFAITATTNPAYLKNDVFHIVFCIVLFSIAFQGTLLPWVAQKLDMIDENADVLKTFTDYQEEQDVQFIRLFISRSHPWCSMKLRDLVLPPEMLIVSIQRGKEILVPNGDTEILVGDTLVITAPAFHDNQKLNLQEIVITAEHNWNNHLLREITMPKDTLVVMGKRDGDVFVPNGNTLIQEGDTLVLTKRI